MKLLREILFTLVAVAGLTFSVSAQKGNDQKKPPKDPPVIKPGDKPPRDNPPPRGQDKPKKPGMAVLYVGRETRSDKA